VKSTIKGALTRNTGETPTDDFAFCK